MTIAVSKLDETTIQVSKDIPVQVDVAKYDLNFLLKQKKAIEADIERCVKARQAELDEVNILIAECKKLGTKPKAKDEDVLR